MQNLSHSRITDHHLSQWSSGWCLSRTVSHRISSGHTPEQNGIIERARILRRERNLKERKGGETAGTVS